MPIFSSIHEGRAQMKYPFVYTPEVAQHINCVIQVAYRNGTSTLSRVVEFRESENVAPV